MRFFPYEYESRRDVLFYPWKPERLEGEVLEIGPGRGELLLSLAEQYPARRFVAIEFLKKRHFKLVRRIERRGLANITLIQGRAQIVMPKLFTCGTFDRVYVMFPDPWPKDRHIPHRLLTVDFVSTLSCVLRVGGDLVVATDHRPYADWVVDNCERVKSLTPLGQPFCGSSEIPDYQPTFFEKKWRDEGRDIFYLRYLKEDLPVAVPWP